MSYDDAHYMRLALAQAELGMSRGEFPFGAVLIGSEGEVVAANYDTVERDNDFTSHAETMLVKIACKATGRRDLSGCTLYTTVAPCPMCFTTSWLARVDRIVWGATMKEVADLTGNAVRELAVPTEHMSDLGGQQVAIQGGVLRDECLALFSQVMATVGEQRA
ncbi:MAG TPA: nucleoside deaminase [Tepidisphaeraceae bacterium]|nr:nucleoside deaminase [Tepidisphaeraceae bacterium]